jgi:hypothetical protein
MPPLRPPRILARLSSMTAMDARLASIARKTAAPAAKRTVKASAVKGLLLARSQELARALAEANRAYPLFKTKK